MAESTPEPSVQELSEKLFKTTADYAQADLQVTLDEYALLAQMNNASTEKYSELKNSADSLTKSLEDLSSNYERLVPFLDKISKVEEQVVNLERLAYALDNYSKRLEARFKSLERR